MADRAVLLPAALVAWLHVLGTGSAAAAGPLVEISHQRYGSLTIWDDSHPGAYCDVESFALESSAWSMPLDVELFAECWPASASLDSTGAWGINFTNSAQFSAESHLDVYADDPFLGGSRTCEAKEQYDCRFVIEPDRDPWTDEIVTFRLHGSIGLAEAGGTADAVIKLTWTAQHEPPVVLYTKSTAGNFNVFIPIPETAHSLGPGFVDVEVEMMAYAFTPPFGDVATANVDVDFNLDVFGGVPPGCGASISGSCTSVHATPGCDEAVCCQLVCAMDAFCCASWWDADCVTLAQSECVEPEPVIWPITNPATGRRYVVTELTGWSMLKAYADSTGGQLATVRNAAENDWIRSQLASGMPDGDKVLWLGLNDLDDEGSFFWDSGLPLTYTNWGPGEPDSKVGEEDVVAMPAEGTWHDVSVLTVRDGLIEIGSLSCGGPEAGGCFEPHGGAGCDETSCCHTVCSIEPFCCENQWDFACVTVAEDFCKPQMIPGSITWRAENNHFYAMLENAAATEAQAAAMELGGTLVIIDDADELAFVNSTYQNFQGIFRRFWLGIHTEGYEANYRDFNNAPANYFNWNTGEPMVGPDFQFVSTVTNGSGKWHSTKNTAVDRFAVIEAANVCGAPLAGDCFSAHAHPNCNDAACCDAVCGTDPACCESTWDAACVQQALAACNGECSGDLDGPGGEPDGAVNVIDLLAILSAWGPNAGHPADLSGPGGAPDGTVDVADLLALLAVWGPCA